MAAHTTNPSSAPSAEVVGKAFVEQYYHILHHSPEIVYRFYKDTSALSHPDINGVMSSVTTMESINDKICSLDYKNCRFEIMTADAQESCSGGVIVLVTGYITREDDHRMIFTQVFFLAPQDKGYFVLNDVLRYLEACEPKKNMGSITRIESLTQVPEGDQNADNASGILEEERQAINGEETVVKAEIRLKTKHTSAESESTLNVEVHDASKKSYASIERRERKKAPTKVYVPIDTSKVACTMTEKLSADSTSPAPAQAPERSPPIESSSGTVPGSKGLHDVEGYSIFINNLPPNVTIGQLETEFKKFGPIKQNGVQVRNNRQQGFSFGFIEFQDLSSMEQAIQASPITIGGHQAGVEMKRSTMQVIGRRNHFSSGRGALRNDSFRGQGNFSGCWASRRSESGYGVNFSRRGGYQDGGGYRQGSGKGTGRGSPSRALTY